MFQLHIQFILVEFKDFFFHLFQSNIYKISKLGQYLLALLRILKGKVIFELLLDFLLKLINLNELGTRKIYKENKRDIDTVKP